MEYFLLFLVFIILYLSCYTKENYYTFNNKCSNLNKKECLRKQNCGWLHDRYPGKGKCTGGSAAGPFDQRLLPDAEEGRYKNRQIDFWTYYNPQQFPECEKVN